jgi:membrane fusion protein (multidrug efflux system)
VTVNENIELAGTIKGWEDIMLSTEEGGIVRVWKVEKGEHIRRGDTLALLKDDVLFPAWKSAEAQAATAQLNFEKQEQVYLQQGISELQYRSAMYARDAAAAQADLARARWQRTIVRSPVTGVMDDRFYDAGEMVPPAVPIARIVDLTRARVQVNIPERYSGAISRGATLEFTVLAYPGEVFRGRVTYIGSTVAPDNRTLTVEGIVDNPAGKLKPDMIAKIRVLQKGTRQAIMLGEDVPQLVDRDRYIVYVVEDGFARQRVVVPGVRGNGKLEILDGLQTGERVVVAGYQTLSDGEPVVVQDDSAGT